MSNIFILFAFALAAWLLPAENSTAQDYPNRPIHLVAPGPAGSGIDTATRVLAERLREAFSQPVIVENRPGADGIVATKLVADAAPDGYTLLISSPSQMSVNVIMRANLPYDSERDFIPLGTIAETPMILVVGAAVPARTLQELVAYAKANPDVLNYGSGASIFMFGTEQLKALTGMPMRHIPYNGLPPVVNALLAGDVQVALLGLSTTAPGIKSGQLRALAMMTPERDPLAPEVPTIAEAGVVGFDVPAWLGVFAPAGTPPDVVARLEAAIRTAVESPELRARLRAVGQVPFVTSSKALAANIKRETAQLRAVAKSAGFVPN